MSRFNMILKKLQSNMKQNTKAHVNTRIFIQLNKLYENVSAFLSKIWIKLLLKLKVYKAMS